MMKRLGLGVGIVVAAAGCKDAPAAPRDGEVAIDAAPDGAPDGAVDAPPDGPPDAPPDAPSPSPRCLTGATRLLDVTPRRIGNFARSGSTLYVSVYDPADPQGPASIITIDLTTNTPAAQEFATPRVLYLVSTDGDADADVFATDDTADGSIWRLHPGSPPAVIVAHRPDPAYIAADATHVYWSESTAPGSPDHVVRRALAGGNVEPVMTCGGPFSLHVMGGYVYCSGQSNVLRHRGDGSGSDEGIGGYPLGYPIFAAMVESSGYYFAPFTSTQMILRADNQSALAATVAGTSVVRAASLSATSDYFYVVDLGSAIRRTHRVTGIEESVYPLVVNHDSANQYAVEYGNQLYFDAQDYNLGGVPYLLHCVD